LAVGRAGAGGADRLHGHVAYVGSVPRGGKTVVVDEANWVPGLVSLGRRVRATEIAGYIYRPGTNAGSPGAGPGAPGAAADTDGDGVPDAADACPLQAGAPANAGCPTGSRFETGDFDNDGRDDALVVTAKRAGRPSGADYRVLTSTGSGFTNAGLWASADDVDVSASRFVTTDLTGDGRTDVIAVTPRRAGAPSGADYRVLTSTGSKLNAAAVWGSADDVDVAGSRFL